MTTARGVVGTTPAVRVSGRSGDATAVLETAREAADTVQIAEVGPTGVDALDPLVMATVDDWTAFVPRCSPATVRDVIESVRNGEQPASASSVLSHDENRATLPIPETGPLAAGDRRVLDACGWVVPTSEDDYLARGELLARARDGDELLERAAATGLCGRGRGDIAADEPVADTWRTVRKADGEPVVVVHANEADSRATADALLLAADPFAVIDPAAAVADAVGAPTVVVFVTETEERAYRNATAVADVVESVANVSIDVVAGPDEYVAGEPTMALEALEGNDRLEARRRPPGPEEHGLFGRPTVLHTPRTLAQLRRLALADGDLPGVEDDPGTRLFDVCGDVAATATVELATDDTLSTLREPVSLEGELKAAAVGGVFGGLTETLDVPTNADELTAADLDTAGPVELLSQDRCAVAFAGRRAAFAHEENCGRCVPCREGSTQLTELLRSVYGDADAIDDVRELARVMNRSSLCAFGRDAARPVTTALTAFESEFLAHADGRCPTGECSE
ncbi:NADH-ubiquinone oxidoreductase-F iron-sulfur binding region domain-containing protein [Natronolimnohabitans sp. A-GB9]|uniref:NADH-ubiquinone oxidoreductase-F iron-sulfur binding region domain-containing protein n=1 Tax=Natronolimnohabitans sp. A-GB9 TaxID=3069757 RepID=UPI0027B51ADD|nr:NADH-ubiquinone oxidoreductase-F iron-sulfur binding region domain-containing protein [Natronolimnohabitans sp. A-GB9]MDQ2051737.1 NADH-ubiquinone oxidoreductase-F iron-sulfur binding region domain-containing protein [Natronolimnohabitans sp. A-GB9]